jgi:hypothetical protein
VARVAAVEGGSFPTLRMAAVRALTALPIPGPVGSLQGLLAEHFASAILLERWDREGRWWQPGRLARLTAAARQDTRLRFIDRLPRSMTFGRLLAELATSILSVSPPSGASLDVAQGINLFVTMFDGLCDDTPECLPDLVPHLRAVFEASGFPAEGTAPGGTEATRLTLELAVACFAGLMPAIGRAPPQVAARTIGAIEAAFAAEIEGLNRMSDNCDRQHAIRQRDALSAATFAATLQSICAIEGADDAQSRALDTVAEACGRLFGWIDDITDLEQDAASGQPNLVSLLIGAETPAEQGFEVVEGETSRRWQALEDAVGIARGSPAILDELRRAALAWLAEDQDHAPGTQLA